MLRSSLEFTSLRDGILANISTGEIMYISLKYRSSVVDSGSDSFTLKRNRDDLETWIASQNENAPPGAEFFEASWVWIDAFTEVVAVNSIVSALVLSTSVAILFVVLFTGNVIVGGFALATISASLFVVMGIFKLIGWKIGVAEAIGFSVLVGLSVDYVFHTAESYVATSKHQSRMRRTSEALTRIGTSIIGGALTTIAATAVLMLCRILIFSNFGVLIVVNTSISIIFATTFFPALLFRWGPTEDTGSLFALFKLCKKNRSEPFNQVGPQEDGL